MALHFSTHGRSGSHQVPGNLTDRRTGSDSLRNILSLGNSQCDRGSADGRSGESHRGATTNSEWKYGACQRRAQSHAASLPPSSGARCRSSRSQKAQTVFLASYHTTFKEQIYNRWCCIHPLRSPRLSGVGADNLMTDLECDIDAPCIP